MTQAYSEKENSSDLNVNVWHMCNGINVMVYFFKPGEECVIQSDTGILKKRKSECSYQKSNLRPRKGMAHQSTFLNYFKIAFVGRGEAS